MFPFIKGLRFPEGGGPSPVGLANEKYHRMSSFLVHVHKCVVIA